MRLPLFLYFKWYNNYRIMRKIVILTIVATLLASACYNEGQMMLNPTPLMQHQFKPTQASLLNVAKTYAETINQNKKKGLMHPGLFSDYGVALAQLGCYEQANVMLNNEKMFFPNNSLYVDYLKSVLTPNYLNSHVTDTSLIDLKTLDTIPITLTPDELALQQQVEADPEYQRLQKQLQKEEKEQQAKALKKAKEQRAKEQANERKAKAKAKEREQKAKAAAKKQAEKERAAAKKQAEKEKAAAKKQAEKEKAAAKKQAEKEKAEAAKAQREAQKNATKTKTSEE